MKFCPKCDDRMSGDLCTTCDKKKLPERIKFSDYSNQKINSCDKGCGGKIYFDEDFKTAEKSLKPILEKIEKSVKKQNGVYVFTREESIKIGEG